MTYEIGGIKFFHLFAAQEKAREYSRRNPGARVNIMRGAEVAAVYMDGVRFATPRETKYYR